nr:hypothetical protein [Tanacetum cinerariifolium]
IVFEEIRWSGHGAIIMAGETGIHVNSGRLKNRGIRLRHASRFCPALIRFCAFLGFLSPAHNKHTIVLHFGSLVSQSLISWRLINLGSMKLAFIEITTLVEITTSVLIEIVPPIEIVLIILMGLNGRKTERSNLICNHLRSETATSDEIAGVEELVLTLAMTALARD